MAEKATQILIVIKKFAVSQLFLGPTLDFRQWPSWGPHTFFTAELDNKTNK